MNDAAGRIIPLYDRNAERFDRERSRSLFEKPWLDRFLSVAPEGGSILDLGCGMGEPLARYMIEAGCSISGIDGAPAMIRFCQRRFPGHEWRVADMRELALGRRFNGLIAWDSFFHLTPEAQRLMFPIFRAHAAPGAALMFTSGPAFGEAIGEYGCEPLYHASLDPAEYRALLADNGFAVVAHIAEDNACGGRTVWLARLLGEPRAPRALDGAADPSQNSF